MLRPRWSGLSSSSSLRCCVPPASRSSHPLRAGGCFSRSHASHEMLQGLGRFVTHLRVSQFVVPMVFLTCTVISWNHECPGGDTAHIVVDSHLKGTTAGLIFSSRHAADSKWSKSLRGVVDSVWSSLVLSLLLTDGSFSFFLQSSSTSTAKISMTCCRLIPVVCEVNIAATSAVLLPGRSSDLALFAALNTLSHSSLKYQLLV